MDYAALKLLHQGAVLLSITGFVARGLGSFAGATWVVGRAAKTLPHVVDTVLLGSAVALAWQAGFDPLHVPWLMAKILGLLAYIGLGMLALRPGRPLALRMAAWCAALGAFGYIVSVALTKDPVGWLVWLTAS